MDDNVFFPHVKKVVANFGLHCEKCATTDLRTQKHIVKHPITTVRPLERVQFDLIQLGTDADGNSYAGNMVDCFSKLVHSEGMLHCFGLLEMMLMI